MPAKRDVGRQRSHLKCAGKRDVISERLSFLCRVGDSDEYLWSNGVVATVYSPKDMRTDWTRSRRRRFKLELVIQSLLEERLELIISLDMPIWLRLFPSELRLRSWKQMQHPNRFIISIVFQTLARALLSLDNGGPCLPIRVRTCGPRNHLQSSFPISICIQPSRSDISANLTHFPRVTLTICQT